MKYAKMSTNVIYFAPYLLDLFLKVLCYFAYVEKKPFNVDCAKYTICQKRIYVFINSSKSLEILCKTYFNSLLDDWCKKNFLGLICMQAIHNRLNFIILIMLIRSQFCSNHDLCHKANYGMLPWLVLGDQHDIGILDVSSLKVNNGCSFNSTWKLLYKIRWKTVE